MEPSGPLRPLFRRGNDRGSLALHSEKFHCVATPQCGTSFRWPGRSATLRMCGRVVSRLGVQDSEGVSALGLGAPEIAVCRPKLPAAESILPYLQRVDARRVYSNHGELVQELQSRLCAHVGLPLGSVVTASSGTAALFAAIIAVAGRGSAERPLAVVPAFTFAATAAAVEQAGYRPLIVDVDRATWTLDRQAVARLAELDRVGVVVPVAPFGRPVPLAPWRDFEAQTGVPVVVDAAAAFDGVSEGGAEFLGETPVCLSFHATKGFSTGEGGCVISTNVELAARAFQALNFGFLGARDAAVPSTNGKMSEYHAAVGLAELDGWAAKRKDFLAVAERYRRELALCGLGAHFVGPPRIGLNYALFACSDAEQSRLIREHMYARSVDFRQWYGAGLHRQTYYARYPCRENPVTEELASLLIGIPAAPDLSASAIARVAGALAKASEERAATAPPASPPAG